MQEIHAYILNIELQRWIYMYMYKERNILKMPHQENIINQDIVDYFVVLSSSVNTDTNITRCLLFNDAIECALTYLFHGISRKPKVYIFKNEGLKEATYFASLNNDLFNALKNVFDL